MFDAIDWNATPAEILAALSITDFEPTNTAVTLTHIRAALPQEAYALVRLTLEAAMEPQSGATEHKMLAAEMADAVGAMRTVGLSFSSPDRQAVIDMLAAVGGWPDVVRDAVKSLGGSNRPRWSRFGYVAAPTLEQITADKLAAQMMATRADWRARCDAALNQAGTNESAEGVAALRAIADEIEAG